MTTAKSVAEAAGVSVATVYRVFNKTAPVRPAVEQRVLEVAEELDFRPRQSQRVPGVCTRTIGFCVPDISIHPFFASMAQGVQEACSSAGYALTISSTDRYRQKEAMHLRMLSERHIDGLVIVPVSRTGSHIAEIMGGDFPVVVLCRRLEDLDAPMILLDNLSVTTRAIEYLLSLGHRRVGMIMPEPDLLINKDRTEGYRVALRNAEVEEDSRLVAMGTSSHEWGYEATVQFLGLAEPPTAILGGSLPITQGVLFALRDLKQRIPEDVSVLSFDDAPWFRLIRPPLSGISQPAHRMGTLAAEVLLSMIETGQDPPEMVLHLQTRLQVRDSCAAPQARW